MRPCTRTDRHPCTLGAHMPRPAGRRPSLWQAWQDSGVATPVQRVLVGALLLAGLVLAGLGEGPR